MFRARTFAVAAVLTVVSWTASAQVIHPIMPISHAASAARSFDGALTELVAQRTSSHRRVLKERRVRLNSELSEVPLSGVVGADNYKYWHQACCF